MPFATPKWHTLNMLKDWQNPLETSSRISENELSKIWSQHLSGKGQKGKGLASDVDKPENRTIEF